MEIMCIARPRPGPWLRAVIVIVIYLVICRVAPDDAIPLAGGGVLGALLASAPGRPDVARAAREAVR